MAAVKRSASEDPHLGAGPDQDGPEASPSRNQSDSGSVLSDDSVLPDSRRRADGKRGPASSTLYGVCSRNQPQALKRVLARGVTKDEVMETDINGWNGLMIACYKGFLEIVYGLHHCPFIDINHQDNDGNTALMIAAQAGHISTVNYLLNYYPGADTEVRDCRGFTALIKATMQGRNNVVAALIMAGADINAVDATKGRCARDWALKTGRFDTLQRLRRLHLRPVAEQFCESYVCEWPELRALAAKAEAHDSSAGAKITQRLKSTFGFSFPRDPRDNGALDHMVRMTSGLRSPLVATGCRPLCPTSPPAAGKRRLAVPELAKEHAGKALEESAVCHGGRGSVSCVTVAPSVHSERRGSAGRCLAARSAGRRNSVFPSACVPQISVSRSPGATPTKERKKKKRHRGYLEPPRWRYKEIREQKKREKQRKAEKEKAEREKRMKEKK